MSQYTFKLISVRQLVLQRLFNGELVDPNNPYLPELAAMIEAARLKQRPPDDHPNAWCIMKLPDDPR